MKDNNVDENNIDIYLAFYFDLHNAYIDNSFKEFEEKHSQFFKSLHFFSTKEFFKSLIRKIDIDIER